MCVFVCVCHENINQNTHLHKQIQSQSDEKFYLLSFPHVAFIVVGAIIAAKVIAHKQ